MVKKSYRTLFKDPTGFKEKVLYCLFDLDRRIKELTGLDELKQVFSLKTHTHNNLYSKINHNHDMVYSLLTHNHDERYSQINHIHSDYVTHLELEGMAGAEHTHNNVCYIIPFRAVDELVYIYCELEPNDITVLEDLNGQIFTVDDILGRYVILANDGADTSKVYHLLYSSTITTEPQDVIMGLNNIIANRGDDVTLYSTVEDSNHNPVDEGTVTFEMEQHLSPVQEHMQELAGGRND